MKTKNQFAQELARLSVKSRFKGMNKKQRSAFMAKVRKGKKFDKRSIVVA